MTERADYALATWPGVNKTALWLSGLTVSEAAISAFKGARDGLERHLEGQPGVLPRNPRAWIDGAAAFRDQAIAVSDAAQKIAPRFVWAEDARLHALYVSEHRPQGNALEDTIEEFERDLDGLRAWIGVATAESDLAARAVADGWRRAYEERRGRRRG